jgi:hypothetical protein
MASFIWTAHSECSEHLKTDLEERVESLLSSYLLRPVAGEVFENPDLCQEHLQGWAIDGPEPSAKETTTPEWTFSALIHS